MVRVLNDAEAQASRTKGVQDAQKLINALPGNLDEKERFQKLSEAFADCAQKCWKPMIDNFDAVEFFRRGNDKKGDDLKIILLGCFKAAAKLQTLAGAMQGIDRKKMNGQAAVFLKQSNEARNLDTKLEIAKKLYTGEINAPVRAIQEEGIYIHGHR